MTARRRADQHLVEAGFFDSRARAQAAIRAGLVVADGKPVARASDLIDPGAAIEARTEHPYVSRGAVKLAHALDAFAVDPAGRVCLDCGASTGGFSEVLVLRGAARVYAVDVGRGQLHPRLATIAAIVPIEGQDIRTLAADRLSPAPSLVVVDVSFISLALVLPAALALATPACTVVALIKPQFEVGRGHLRKGIARDEDAIDAACWKIATLLVELGCIVSGPIASPIRGGDGNREFLIAGRRGGGA